MSGPVVGAIEQGHRFKGGDPADQNSWEQVIEDGYKLVGSDPSNKDSWVPVKAAPPPVPEIINEMPADVSLADRMLTKNFANDPEVIKNHLAKKYPQYKVTHEDGQIYFEDRAGKKRVLDPGGLEQYSLAHPIQSLKEAAMDVGDVGYDALAGTGTAAATAFGGASGLIGGPGGALAGGAAAGAGASAGLEAGREAIGKAIGIDQQIDPVNVGIAGGVGAISPFLFGTGADAAQILRSGLGKKAIASGDVDALKAALASQRGAGGRLLDWGKGKIPKVIESFSGIPREDINTAMDKLSPEMSGVLQKSTKEGLLENVPLGAEAKQALQNKIKPGASGFDAIEALSDSGKNSFVKNYYKGIGKDFSDLTRVTGKGMEKVASDATGTFSSEPVLAPYIEELANANKKLAMNPESTSLKQSVQAVKDTIVDLFGKIPKDEYTGEELHALKMRIKEASGVANVKPGLLNRFSKSATGAEKELALAGGKSLDAAKDGLHILTDGAYASLSDQHAMIEELRRNLSRSLAGPQAADSTLRNLSSRAKEHVVENLTKLGQLTGKDYLGPARLISAYNTFSKAPLTAMSRTGVSGAQKAAWGAGLGGTLGWMTGYGLGSQSPGGGYAGGRLGAMTGAGAGLALTSPAMIKMAIQNALKAGQVKDQVLTPMVRRSVRSAISPIGQSAWLGLYGDKENR